MDPIDIAILTGAAFFTSALTTATGVGGGTIMLALMLQIIPPAAAIPVHGAVQTVSNGWRIWLLREQFVWPLILRFGLPMPLGVVLGLWLFQGLPRETVQILIGCTILLTLFSRSLKAMRGRELPLWGFVPLGFAVGALNMVVGVVVPVLSAFLIRRDLSRHQVVATISVFSLIGHILKVIGFSLVGFSFAEYGPAIVAMIPAIVVGTYAGRHLLSRLSDALFQNVMKVVLALLALKLIVWDSLLRGMI